MRELFGQSANDGRAVLVGTDEEPEAWLSWPDPSRDLYCLCWSRRERMVFVEGSTPLYDLRRVARMKVH